MGAVLNDFEQGAECLAAERRAFRRRVAKGVVRGRVGKFGMGKEFQGELLDISADGAAIVWPQEVNAGDEIEMELSGHASRQGFKVRATVRNVRADLEGTWVLGCRFEKRLAYHQITELTR